MLPPTWELDEKTDSDHYAFAIATIVLHAVIWDSISCQQPGDVRRLRAAEKGHRSLKIFQIQSGPMSPLMIDFMSHGDHPGYETLARKCIRVDKKKLIHLIQSVFKIENSQI